MLQNLLTTVSSQYPTRFKVLTVSENPTYSGNIVEIFDVDLNVDQF